MLLPRRMKARRYTLRGIGAKTTGGCKDGRVLPFSDRIVPPRQGIGSAMAPCPMRSDCREVIKCLQTR
jgi:hypothetical protein